MHFSILMFFIINLSKGNSMVRIFYKAWLKIMIFKPPRETRGIIHTSCIYYIANLSLNRDVKPPETRNQSPNYFRRIRKATKKGG